MKCPKGPRITKNFWIFKWIVQEDHRQQMHSIHPVSSNFSEEFRVHCGCKYCGKPETFHRVKWDTLIKYGVDNDVLNDILRGRALELPEGKWIDVQSNIRVGD